MSFSITISDVTQDGYPIYGNKLAEIGRKLAKQLVDRGLARKDDIEVLPLGNVLFLEVLNTTPNESDQAIHHILYTLEEWDYRFEFDLDGDIPQPQNIISVYTEFKEATEITARKLEHLQELFREQAGADPEDFARRFSIEEDEDYLGFEVICENAEDMEAATNFFKLTAGRLAIASCRVDGYQPPEDGPEYF